MNRPSSPLPRAAAGLFLLALSLLPAGSLSLGGPGAHAAVYFLLLALAGLALGLLFLSGLDRDRLLAALLPVGLALFLRALLLDYQSQDYQVFLSQWAAAFRDNGGFAAVKLPIGNYNAPYLYFLAAISYLPIPDLYLIKLFSVLFDVVLAWGGFRLVGQLCPGDRDRPLLCFCVLLLLPTAVVNGAFWGQCDALYGALVVHALACALEKRPCASLALLGVAFSFKLQTVFVLPLWGALVLLGWAPLRALLCFPAAYAATCVPALLLGKPLGDILGVYFGQAAEYAGYLNLNAPNLYAFLPHGAQVDTAVLSRLGIAAALVLALAVAALLWLRRRQADGRALLPSGTSSWPTCSARPWPAPSPPWPPSPCWSSCPPSAPTWWCCGRRTPASSPWAGSSTPCCARGPSCWGPWSSPPPPWPSGCSAGRGNSDDTARPPEIRWARRVLPHSINKYRGQFPEARTPKPLTSTSPSTGRMR